MSGLGFEAIILSARISYNLFSPELSIAGQRACDMWLPAWLQDDFPLDSVVQNFLAVILATVLALALAAILVKLAAVVWALAAAAIRYSIVALILVALTLFLG